MWQTQLQLIKLISLNAVVSVDPDTASAYRHIWNKNFDNDVKCTCAFSPLTGQKHQLAVLAVPLSHDVTL